MIIHCFLLFYILGRKFTIFFTKVVKFFLIGDKKITACFIRMPLFLRIVIFFGYFLMIFSRIRIFWSEITCMK